MVRYCLGVSLVYRSYKSTRNRDDTLLYQRIPPPAPPPGPPSHRAIPCPAGLLSLRQRHLVLLRCLRHRQLPVRRLLRRLRQKNQHHFQTTGRRALRGPQERGGLPQARDGPGNPPRHRGRVLPPAVHGQRDDAVLLREEAEGVLHVRRLAQAEIRAGETDGAARD